VFIAINTSTIQFSIALLEEDGTVIAEVYTSPGQSHFSGFMPTLDQLLHSAEMKKGDPKALIIAKGPGSFTGLRVGLAAAKGLSQGLQIPIIGVSGLEALVSQMPHSAYPICPVIDARKGEVFTALFHWSETHHIVRMKEEVSLRFEDLDRHVDEKTVFLGNNYPNQGPLITDILGQNALLAPAHLWRLSASAVGAVGLKRFLVHDFDDPRDLVPSYLRPPDIRPNPFPLLATI
jgi:tRNA threonylcarbamoyladenosine biosynthesis protein TsaB